MPRGTRTAAIAAGIGGALVAVQLCGAAAASAATVPAVLSAIKQCESGGNYTAVNPSSGASGAYQFLTSTWQSLSASAGYATAAAAPPAVQDAAALELYNEDGTAPWASSESCWAPLVASSSSSASSSLTPASAATPSVSPAARPYPAFAPGRGPARWDPAHFSPNGAGVRLCPGGAPGPHD
jgi:resuscitation-promoting factor RpfA